MNIKVFVVVFIMVGLCMSFVSASFFGDIFNKITGKAIEEKVNIIDGEIFEIIPCEQVKEIFDKDFINYEIPRATPFKSEVFNMHIDKEFFVSVELIDKKITGITCDESSQPTYNIYVTNSLVGEVVEGFSEDNLIDYYNQKRKSGELEIEPIGIARKLKMGFINLGLKIASWFS